MLNVGGVEEAAVVVLLKERGHLGVQQILKNYNLFHNCFKNLADTCFGFRKGFQPLSCIIPGHCFGNSICTKVVGRGLGVARQAC